MSHYIYRKKHFVETEDGRILPLVKYSDSSITEGHGRNEHHPSWWAVMNLGNKSLLVEKEEWKRLAQREYDRQIELLTEFDKKYGDTYGRRDPIGPDSRTYGGDTYPGGGRLKNMRAFLSVRRTISVQDFIHKTLGCTISMEPLIPGSWQSYDNSKVEVFLRDEESFTDAENKYQELREKYPDSKTIVIGVSGLW